MLQNKIFKLRGKVQHYAWGGFDFIPSLIGKENTAHKPYAEYWMGAHPLASAEIEAPHGLLSLQRLIEDQHTEFIGDAVFQQFGELPYLFKILDVKDMLSIQVHPTRAAAEAGYAAEEAAGIKLDSSFRNYKDKNHKPEVMVALSSFWLLHGFRQKEDLKNILQAVPGFGQLLAIYGDGDYKKLSEHVMFMPQQEVNDVLVPLIQREILRRQNGELTRADPGWWVSKLYEEREEWGNIDRGVFSIYFFNIVNVNQGEAVFQGAGIPHAYLEGQNVELMANSDNVLRGGLTPKHVDVPELLKHTLFEAVEPNVMKGEQKEKGEVNYPCPVADFGVSKIELSTGNFYLSTAHSLETFVVIEGGMQVNGTANNLYASKGEAVVVLAGETYNISTDSHVLTYKAFVP